MNNTSKTTIQECPSSPDLLLKLISTKKKKIIDNISKVLINALWRTPPKLQLNLYNTSFSIFPSVTEQKILKTEVMSKDYIQVYILSFIFNQSLALYRMQSPNCP